MLGDTGDNLESLLDEVIKGLGGQDKLADHLTRYIKDPNGNPYLQSRAIGSLFRIMEKVDARKQGDTAALSDAEVDAELAEFSVRFLVTMPADVFEPLMADVVRKRAEHAERERVAEAQRQEWARPA